MQETKQKNDYSYEYSPHVVASDACSPTANFSDQWSNETNIVIKDIRIFSYTIWEEGLIHSFQYQK